MSKPHEDRTASFILIGIGIIPVVWAALIVAPFLSQGLKGIIEGFTIGMREPLSIQWCPESPKAILLFLLFFGVKNGCKGRTIPQTGKTFFSFRSRFKYF